MLESILRIEESKFGPDHPQTLNGRNNLGKAYLDSGRVAEATAVFEKTLKGREREARARAPGYAT